MAADTSAIKTREDTQELNQWARLISQTYIYWYTGFFALNATALAVVLHEWNRKWWPLFMLFVFFNVLGVGSSLSVAIYGYNTSARLEKANELISPFPLGLWKAITAICGFSLLGMAALWAVLMTMLLGGR
jgi:hypothetical protein